MYRNTWNIHIHIYNYIYILYIYILNYQAFPEVVHFQDTQTKQPWNVHILMHPTKCSKLIDPLWHLLTISLDPFNPLSILHLPSGWSPFWKAPSPTPEALPPMACDSTNLHRRRWKNVKAKEPCRVWGLNSAALVHYVDRSWHMQHMHEVAWTLKKRNCLRHLWNSFWRWLTPSHKTNPTRVQVAKIATLAPAMVFQLACTRRAWLGQKPLQTNTLYHIYNM